MKRAAFLLYLCATVGIVYALDNGLAITPQMGWNSWNHFSCDVNENVIRSTIDAMISTGLAAAGYNYVNVDDCWAYDRDNVTGAIRSDPNTFPSGMKALADYAHSKGLKFGLYSDAGNLTCAGRPGSLGYERIDAETYASWNVDYLKYDNCNSGTATPEVRYPIMRDALNATGRDIFYSMCEWGVDNPATWAPKVGNSWRTTGDISDDWGRMLYCLDINEKLAKYAGPGGWNDPDMLEVGNGGMTLTEYRSHFSLWSLMKAPLLIGCDVTNMRQDILALLTNPEVIAVNQDPLGIQGSKVNVDGFYEVWAGKLSGGSQAVILFNRDMADATINLKWSMLGISPIKTCTVRDLWARQDLGQFQGGISAQVPAHGVMMYKITPN